MQENSGKNKKGNFTIECALIMPIILVCILAVVWLIIFLYDKNVMYRAMIHAVSAADYKNSSTNGELKKEIEERLYEDLNNQLVGVKESSVSVKVGAKKVTVTVEGKLNVPMSENILSSLSEIELKVTKKRMDAAGIIADVRRVKALYDIADKIINSDDNSDNMEEK